MDDDYRPGMASPFNPTDHLPDLRLVDADPLPPPPVTGANGAPGAESDDEGPNASDQWTYIRAASSHPAVGRA